MFPTCRVSFSGLKSEGRYAVLMDIVPVDNKRYRYAYHRSCWLVAGKADPPAPARLYVHPDSPFTGDQLRKQVVSFEKVKLTNNDMDKHGQVRKFASNRLIACSCTLVKLVCTWVKYRSRQNNLPLCFDERASHFYDCEIRTKFVGFAGRTGPGTGLPRCLLRSTRFCEIERRSKLARHSRYLSLNSHIRGFLRTW